MSSLARMGLCNKGVAGVRGEGEHQLLKPALGAYWASLEQRIVWLRGRGAFSRPHSQGKAGPFVLPAQQSKPQDARMKNHSGLFENQLADQCAVQATPVS